MITRSGSQAASAGPAEYFTGDVRVQPLFAEEDAAVYGAAPLAFAPRARSAWHTHPPGSGADPPAQDVGTCDASNRHAW